MIQLWNSVNSPSLLNFSKLVKGYKDRGGLEIPVPSFSFFFDMYKKRISWLFVGILLSNKAQL